MMPSSNESKVLGIIIGRSKSRATLGMSCTHTALLLPSANITVQFAETLRYMLHVLTCIPMQASQVHSARF